MHLLSCTVQVILNLYKKIEFPRETFENIHIKIHENMLFRKRLLNPDRQK